MKITLEISLDVATWAIYFWLHDGGSSIKTISAYKKALALYVTKYGLNTIHNEEVDSLAFNLEMSVCKNLAKQFHS